MYYIGINYSITFAIITLSPYVFHAIPTSLLADSIHTTNGLGL